MADGELREEGNHRVFETQLPLIDRNADQGRGHAFGIRAHVMDAGAVVRIEIRVHDDPPVPDDQQAVNVDLLFAHGQQGISQLA